MLYYKSIIKFAIVLLNVQVNEKNKRLLCYYTNWSKYRKGNAKFLPENIDSNLCTHIIFAYAKLDNYTLAPYEKDDVIKTYYSNRNKIKGLYERVTSLKIKNSNLKVMLSVGGSKTCLNTKFDYSKCYKLNIILRY